MPWIFLDAAAQSTAPSAITNIATTVVLASSAAFGAPATGDKVPLIILDSGNGSWNALNPLATPYEYVDETLNTVGTNTITITRAQGGTTAQSFSAGATIAAVAQSRMFAVGTGAFGRIDAVNMTPNLGLVPVKIDEQTVAGAVAASITVPSVGSLPTGFRHLMVVVRGRGDNVASLVNLYLRFNGDNTNTYDFQSALANGVGANVTNTESLAVSAGVIGDIPANAAVAGAWGHCDIMISDYNANIRKTARGNSFAHVTDATGGSYQRQASVGWRTIAVLANFTLLPSAGNFSIGTEVTTYGVP